MATINSWGSQDPAQVAKGGTGVASTTAFAVICGGTTATGPLQSIASVGTAGHALISNGAGALPTFQTNSEPNGFNNWTTTFTTTSATFVDVTDLSTNITTMFTSKIYAIVTFSANTSAGGSSTFGVRIVIDAQNGGEVQRFLSGATDTGIGSVLHLSTSLAAGTYTVKVQMYRVSGGGTPQMLTAQLFAEALRD